MAIDFNNLSADELFELAKRKRQDEEREKARLASVAGLRERRKQVAEEHKRALEGIDAQIREMHQKRGQMALRYKQEVDAIDAEIENLSREARSAQPASNKGTAPSSQPPQAPVKSGPEGGLEAAIVSILRERKDISEGLLKERLKARGFNVTGLSKELQRLIKVGLVVDRGRDNYALKKR